MLQLIRTDSQNPDFRALVNHLDKELALRDGAEHAFYSQFNTIDSIRYCVVAYYDGEAAGIGALRPYQDQTVEIKRMYVNPSFRRKGIAHAVLTELEKWAAELIFSSCILETGLKQPEAIGLYERAGYHRIPNYGQYLQVENSVCMEKRLNTL